MYTEDRSISEGIFNKWATHSVRISISKPWQKLFQIMLTLAKFYVMLKNSTMLPM